MTLLSESMNDLSHGASLPADRTPAIRSSVGSAAATGNSDRPVASAHVPRPATTNATILRFDICPSHCCSRPPSRRRRSQGRGDGIEDLELDAVDWPQVGYCIVRDRRDLKDEHVHERPWQST